MNPPTRLFRLVFLVSAVAGPVGRADDPPGLRAETRLAGPDGLSVTVRAEGPYDADVPLQIVCYFRRTPDSDKRMTGAPVELDRRLGGLIGALRGRGEFAGDDLETLLVDVPEGTIKPKRLLLVGLGDGAALSLDKMERVGRAGVREAARLGATRVAFAPLLRDQGNDALETGAVEAAVTRGVLLAYDTERRLQKQGFARPFALTEWVVEAGPAYLDETVAGVRSAVAGAAAAVKARDAKAYSTKSR